MLSFFACNRSHRKCQAPGLTGFADEGVCSAGASTAHTFVGSYVFSVRNIGQQTEVQVTEDTTPPQTQAT